MGSDRIVVKLFNEALSMFGPVFLFCCFVGGLTFSFKAEQTCGVETSTNLIHHNPWLVFLEYWRGDYLTELRCTATLIDSFHVITAAHCIMKDEYTRLVARLGEYDLTEAVDCVDNICSPSVVLLDVVEKIVHPDYDGHAHDIGVLKLSQPAPYTDFIRPVCLPRGELKSEITFTASGWGEIPRLGHYSSIKKIIPLPLWKRDDCVVAYKYYEVPPQVICAGGVEGVDTCRGDSGGPLLWIRDRIELWGVTSIGNVNCGTEYSPGLYTNVADHLEWILYVVKMHNTKLLLREV